MPKHYYKMERFLSRHFPSKIWKFSSLNFHIKIITMLVIAINISFTGIATEIKVPVLWTLNKVAKANQIEQVGFYEDSGKYVFAIKIKGFAETAKLPRTMISIYLETDDNKETGRLATGGTDLQMNIPILNGKIGLINWANNKANYMTLYEDDYLLQMNGDVYYIAIRKESLNQIVFSGSRVLGVRVIGVIAGNEPIIGVDTRCEIGKSATTIIPSLDFVSFHYGKDNRQSVKEALLISRKDDLKVWNTFGEFFLESEPMPPIVARDSVLRIKAACGEKESAIFAVSSASPLKSLNISLKDLRNKDKTIDHKAFDIKHIGFVSNDRNERFSDILLSEFKPHKSLHNHIAITVTVPPNATPGTYRGMIALIVNGKTVDPIPLELEVYGFKLPEKPYIQTAFCIKSSYVSHFFKDKRNVSVPKQTDMLWDLCHEYRFSPRLMLASPQITLTSNEEIKIDWTKFNKRATKYFDNFTIYQNEIFQLGSHDDFLRLKFLNKDMKIGDNLFNRIWPQIVKQVYDYHKNAGLLDKTLFIIWDEPYTVWKEINTAAELAKKVAPDLKLGVFIGHYEPAIAANIDIWLSRIEFLQANRNKVKRIWVYNSNKMGHFNIPASDIRSRFWLARKYDVEGYLYSEINMWSSCAIKGEIIQIGNPNFNWMYPDPTGGSPRASLRMIHIRDGIDDYDYFTIYQNLLQKRGENMLKEIEQAFPTLASEEEEKIPLKSNRKLLEIRDKVAKEIERLSVGK